MATMVRVGGRLLDLQAKARELEKVMKSHRSVEGVEIMYPAGEMPER